MMLLRLAPSSSGNVAFVSAPHGSPKGSFGAPSLRRMSSLRGSRGAVCHIQGVDRIGETPKRPRGESPSVRWQEQGSAWPAPIGFPSLGRDGPERLQTGCQKQQHKLQKKNPKVHKLHKNFEGSSELGVVTHFLSRLDDGFYLPHAKRGDDRQSKMGCLRWQERGGLGWGSLFQPHTPGFYRGGGWHKRKLSAKKLEMENLADWEGFGAKNSWK